MTNHIEQMVERQVLKWQALRQAAAEAATSERSAPTLQQPMIAVSRELGSLGTFVAESVARALGFECYDRELVERVADSAHVRRFLVESVDERTQSAIENWLGRQIGHAFFAENDYVRNLGRVLLTLGRHGRGVLIGRAAQYILDAEQTLRVRVVAPLALRVERVAGREHLDAAAARARVMRIDAERDAFVRRHFGKDLTTLIDYDLTLNTAHLAPELCTSLVVQAFRARFPHGSRVERPS